MKKKQITKEKLRDGVYNSVKSGVSSDWVWDGEDEYEVEDFDIDFAVNSVIEFLNTNELIDYEKI